MIIVCAGDSFTAGTELWEEKNVPGYIDIKNPKQALVVSKKTYLENQICDEDRKKLSYTNYLADSKYNVINLGISGSSQIDSIQRAIIAISKIRENNHYEKIVCILQNTNSNRTWIWNDKIKCNDSFIMTKFSPKFDLSDAIEIRSTLLKYSLDDYINQEFYLQILALHHYCAKQNINFVHFDMVDKQHEYTISSHRLLKQNALLEKFHIKDSMYKKLYSHFNDDTFLLPSMHFNCDSHKLIAYWLMDELRKRDIL
jgi:hypothetical protein